MAWSQLLRGNLPLLGTPKTRFFAFVLCISSRRGGMALKFEYVLALTHGWPNCAKSCDKWWKPQKVLKRAGFSLKTLFKVIYAILKQETFFLNSFTKNFGKLNFYQKIITQKQIASGGSRTWTFCIRSESKTIEPSSLFMRVF